MKNHQTTFPFNACETGFRDSLLCRCTRWLAAGAAALAVMSAPADELPEHLKKMARDYASVQEWQGIWEAVETSGESGDGSGMRVLGANMEWTSRGKFTLRRDEGNSDPAFGVFAWTGDGAVTGARHAQATRWAYSGIGSETTARSAGLAPRKGATFSVWLIPGEATIAVGEADENMPETLQGVSVARQVRNGREELRSQPIDRTTPNAQPYLSPLRIKYLKGDTTFNQAPGVLSFSDRDEKSGKTGGTTTRWSYYSHLILFPVYDNLEVSVTIDGYAKWRPEGSIAKPGEVGNHLLARATLKHKDGKPGDDLPKVKQFRFELIGTSREPGVAMNWPLEAKDNDLDLRLTYGETGGDLADEDQKLDVRDPPKDDKQQPYADVKVESIDFGGRSELRVICELEDGRELIGLLKDESGEQELVRLPKTTAPGDWVAEVWRKDNKVADLPASDDEEKVEGQKYNGDGFTLYEEYRGWVENGKHISGHPRKKDFFVLNDMGADGIGGIRLFQREAQLSVHYQLRHSEMSKEQRVMNGNHRDAPHRVRQHGVRLEKSVGNMAVKAMTTGIQKADAAYAFRPGLVREVRIEPRGLPDQIFSAEQGVSLYQLNARDAALAYDRAVAHELLHVVGVDHHGEGGESERTYYFQAAGDPNNLSGHAGFTRTSPYGRTPGMSLQGFDRVYDGREMLRQPVETLISEETGRNLAEDLAQLFEQKLAERRAQRNAHPPAPENDPGRYAVQYPLMGKSAEYWRESDLYDAVANNENGFAIRVIVGGEGGADSGNELCLMRYYFATAYAIKGRERTYYVVRPGANRAGRSLCRSPEGTGGNAATHHPQSLFPPQSRFGDAYIGRGNCFNWICPNDAIPPPKIL